MEIASTIMLDKMTFYLKIFFISAIVMFLSGCSKPNKEPQPSKTVEDMTGMTAIKQGEHMKKQVKEFEKKEQERVNEALNREE
jgi:hypothetical protein